MPKTHRAGSGGACESFHHLAVERINVLKTDYIFCFVLKLSLRDLLLHLMSKWHVLERTIFKTQNCIIHHNKLLLGVYQPFKCWDQL